MPNYLSQVTLFPVSNVLADAVVNTFSFSALTNADVTDIHAALVTQYNLLSSIFPVLVRQNSHTIKTYDRADAKPRAPVLQTTWNLTTAPSGAPCPPEVAFCLSFQGSAASGIPQARRRGRVYFGPLDISLVSTDGRPNSSLLTSVKAFGQGLLDASDAAPNWEWTVWSSVTPGSTFVTNGWVDDEFDTQRRRGRLATQRQTFL